MITYLFAKATDTALSNKFLKGGGTYEGITERIVLRHELEPFTRSWIEHQGPLKIDGNFFEPVPQRDNKHGHQLVNTESF